MKKILFIHHAQGWGGAPINMINIINNLDKSLFIAEVLLIKDSIVSVKLAEYGIKFSIARSPFYRKHYHCFIHSDAYFVKWYQIFRLIRLSILWQLSRYYFASRELNHFKYDIVHLNSSVLTDWLAPCSKKGKVIYHIQEPLTRGTLGLRFNIFRNLVKKYASSIIAISIDHLERISLPSKTIVIYNYAEVPLKETDKESYCSQAVLYLGGAEYMKGFLTIVDSLNYIEDGVNIYFAGNYQINNSLLFLLKCIINLDIIYEIQKRKAIRKISNNKHAIKVDFLNNPGEYFEKVCCVVSPFSLPHFSRPVIEAQINKKANIVTNIKGIEEIVDHERDGLIVPKNSPAKLAEAINYIAKNPSIARKYGENGFTKALEKFSPRNIELYQRLYSDL